MLKAEKEKENLFQMNLKEHKTKEKQNITDGMNYLNDEKESTIDTILNEIDYKNIIKKSFEHYSDQFKQDFFKNISKILNDSLKSKKAVKEMHQTIFKKIKNDIPEIKTLNFIICGLSESGKSTITNVILRGDLAKEGNDNHSVTQNFIPYSNPDKVPGITIYDTIGIEFVGDKRYLNEYLNELKIKIQDTFDKNLKEPQNSLHGILYCIRNGTGDNKLLKEEIQLIKELDKLNGNHDILTIIFTQSFNHNTEKRIEVLKEALNNDNIEIISMLAKDYELKIANQSIKFPAFGLDKLIASMKKNAQKIVKKNLKQIVKNKIKNGFIEVTSAKYDDIKRKIKLQEFESTFTKECELILGNLIGNLNLNFDGLEKVVSDFIEKLNLDVKNKFIDENQSNGLNKLNKEFWKMNDNYDRQIKDPSLKDNFMTKLHNYNDKKVMEDARKIILEKASLLFIEKSIELFSEIISDNVEDEDVENIVNSTLDNIFANINRINHCI